RLFLLFIAVYILFYVFFFFFFFQAEDGIRDATVTGVQTCALPICSRARRDCLARSARKSSRTCFGHRAASTRSGFASPFGSKCTGRCPGAAYVAPERGARAQPVEMFPCPQLRPCWVESRNEEGLKRSTSDAQFASA